MSNVPPTEASARPPVNEAGDGQVIPESRVKQGRQGYPVFAVLAVSTVLAVIVLFAVWAMYSHRLNAHGQEGGQDRVKSAAARSFNTPESAPKMTPGPGSAPAAPNR